MKAFVLIGFLAGAAVGSIATYVVTSNSSSTAIATAPACTNEAIAKAIAKKPDMCPTPVSQSSSASFAQPTDEEASIAFRQRLDAVKSWKSAVKMGACQEGGTASHITCGVEVDWKGDGKDVEQRSVGFTKSADGWIAQLY